MTFDWSRYLNLARKLAGTAEAPGDEAELRAAISRAYYAAFMKARNLLRDRDGLIIPRKNAHQYVIKQFRNSSEKLRKRIGERLLNLRYYRNQADYEDTVTRLTEKSQEALTLARRIIAVLDGL